MADVVSVAATQDGVRLRLRVKPSARTDRLVGPHAGALKLEVRAAPERGKANQAVARVVADGLEVRRTQVEVTAGRGSRNKTVVVHGLEVAAVIERLEAMGIPARTEVVSRKP